MIRYTCCVLVLLFGCQTQTPNTATFRGTAMTIDYKVIVGKGLTNREKGTVESIIFQTFSEIDTIYNNWNPRSELSKLNQLPAGVKAPISQQLEHFLIQTDALVQLTDGRFDPTIEPLQKLWKTQLAKGKVPSEEEIRTLTPAIGWDKVHFGQGIFSKEHHLTQLDLGGVVKGYCVDLILERLGEEGYPNAFVEWGGEIRAAGKHPDERPWNIFISRLGNENPESAIAHLSLCDQAIATSGDYLQNWTVVHEGEKKTYHHIIDPYTLTPLQVTSAHVASASVLAKTCALADGLATAAMLFPTAKEAQNWAEQMQEQMPELTFWLVTREEN